MNKRKYFVALVVLTLFAFSLGAVAVADTIEVPDDYSSITAALANAESGDLIEVRSDYDSSNDTYPILVQKDNIVIDGNGATIEEGPADGDAIFVVGALKAYDDNDPDTYEPTTYRDKTVTGVTIADFRIFEPDNGTGGNAEVAFVLNNAEDVIIEDNIINASGEDDTLLQGIRLVAAKNSEVRFNEIVGMGDNSAEPNGIGIFLEGEETQGNAISSNLVADSGLGAFLFEAVGNLIDGDEYVANSYGGVVVNDSVENELYDLKVGDNGGWGVRFVHSSNNYLENSWIEGNGYGGVELVGASENKVDSNIVYNNGMNSEVSHVAQIVVTKGEKGILRVEQKEQDLDPEEFVEEKEKIVAKLDLLDEWLVDLGGINDENENYGELGYVHKQVSDNSQTASKEALRTIVADIQTSSVNASDSDFGKISPMSGDTFEDAQGRKVRLLGTLMEDPTFNFTLDEASEEFDYQGVLSKDDLDKYAGGDTPNGEDNMGTLNTLDDFGLNYSGDYSWDKLGIMHLLVEGAIHEFYNEFEDDVDDSLWEKIEYFEEEGWITDNDKTDLKGKIFGDGQPADLEATSGTVGALNDTDALIFDGTVDEFDDSESPPHPDNKDGYYDILDYIVNLYLYVESGIDDPLDQNVSEQYINYIDELRGMIRNDMDIVKTDLCMIDLELPPFPEVETTLAEKKEKPFHGIDYESVGNGQRTSDYEFPLSGDPASDIGALGGDQVTPLPVEETIEEMGVVESRYNEIASNVITTDEGKDFNAGILLESPYNTVVNNLITNEKVEPIDDEAEYDQHHILDVGIYLLSNNNTLAYNTIEFIDTAIIRGGSWGRQDYQLDYNDADYAEIAYWPGPGLRVDDACETYTEDNFDKRPISWVPVHTLSNGVVEIEKADNEAKVKWNDLALNFIEGGGVGIDIVSAESNDIFANLFYQLENTDILFNATEEGYKLRSIEIFENDHYGVGGTASVYNEFSLNADASEDYTPPEGEDGHTTVVGKVSPPAANEPNSYANFGTVAKFDELGISSYFPGTEATDTLPPNLNVYLRDDVVLPEEKPRNPDDIFGESPSPTPEEHTKTFSAGSWHMMSIPVTPDPDDCASVIGDDLPSGSTCSDLVYGPYDGTEYDNPPAEVSPFGGYWLYAPEGNDLEVGVDGVEPSSKDLVLERSGWFMIGTPQDIYWGEVQVQVKESGGSFESIKDVVGEEGSPLYNVIYYYDPVAGEYIIGTDPDGETLGLYEWEGYWVLVNDDADLPVTLKFEEASPSPTPPPPPEASVLGSSAVPMSSVEKDVPAPPPHPFTASTEGPLKVAAYSSSSLNDQVTFTVTGEGYTSAEGMKVEVQNLSGEKVFSSESSSKSLTWETGSAANGVYLYVASVKVDGQFKQTNIGKVLVLK